MPPTQNERPQDASPPQSDVFIFPHAPSPIDLTSLSTTTSEISTEPAAPLSPVLYEVIEIPREPTLKELVQRSTGLDEINEATRIKLQVIAADVSLQYLSYYTPILSELILDGSIVSSLRDLGCGLKCLKVLRVNRCGLKHIDGTSGLESLEELYASKNSIKDIAPCSNLPNIKVIDVRKNSIVDISALTFLSLCSNLEHIWLDENEDIVNFPKYRQTVKNLLPSLKTLDGSPFTDDECSNAFSEFKCQKEESICSPSTSKLSPKKESVLPRLNICANQPSTSEGTYVVGFAPKVLSPRRQSYESPRNIHVKKVLPEIYQSKVSARKLSTPESSEDSHSSNS